MTTTDLLKLCDEVLELSGRATPGPWNSYGSMEVVLSGTGVQVPPHVTWSRLDPQGRRCTSFVARCDGQGCNNEPDATLIATSRTALPILASALKGLLPYMDHSDECEQRILDHEDGEPLPCTCGLSSTLSALEGQASRG